MDDEIQTKAKTLAATVEKHAETLRRLIRRNPAPRDQDALRSILEAHEGYTKACEQDLIQREIAKSRSR